MNLSPPSGAAVPSHAAPFPVALRLQGRYGALRPLDPQRDGPELYRLSHGPEKEAVWAYLPPPPFESEAAFVAHATELNGRTDMVILVIADPDDRPLGWLTLMRIDAPNRVLEIGYVLYTPTLQRTRLATEAFFLTARHVFDTLGYRRFEWKCNALNAPSKAAAERYGFTFEGRFRQHLIIKGHNRDTDWYSMLDHEWPAVKARFERWLDPINFDAAGQQKARLAAL